MKEKHSRGPQKTFNWTASWLRAMPPVWQTCCIGSGPWHLSNYQSYGSNLQTLVLTLCDRSVLEFSVDKHRGQQIVCSLTVWLRRVEPSGVNFINILREPFSYESKLNSLSLIILGFAIFLRQNICKKVTCKKLMKLTPEVNVNNSLLAAF